MTTIIQMMTTICNIPKLAAKLMELARGDWGTGLESLIALDDDVGVLVT